MVLIDIHELLTEYFSDFLDRALFGDNTNGNNMVDLKAKIEIPHNLISDNKELANYGDIFFTIPRSGKVNQLDTQRYLNAISEMIMSLSNGKVIRYKDKDNTDNIKEAYEQELVVRIKDNNYKIKGYVNDIDIDYENNKETSYRINIRFNVEQKGN